MLGFPYSPIFHFPSKLKSASTIFPPQTPNLPSKQALKPQLLNFNTRKQLRIHAEKGSNGNKKQEESKEIPADKRSKGEEAKAKVELPRFNLRWTDLLLYPDPDNFVAVGLTGLLTWASVQVLWQFFVVSAAILIAAVKYSLVAAILIFILITLL